jgi:hypothetical protein
MKDRNGKLINVGDTVRICGIPDLSGMSPEAQRESAQVFEYLVGKMKRIVGIDSVGNAEIKFEIKNGDLKRIHWVGIEPRLLKKSETKNPNNVAQGTVRKLTDPGR